MEYIKLGIILLLRIVLKIFYIFPVKKNRVYLSSYRGTSRGDNPGYIYKYMQEMYPGQYEYIWEYKGTINDKDVKCVRPGSSLTKFKYLLTSGVIISNCGLGSYIPKRKSQLFINTWHGGGAYKRVGIDDRSSQNKVEDYITKICGRQTDFFVSSSRKFTEVMSSSKLIPKERFLECGMPRNDRLVNGAGAQDLKIKIYEKYNIPDKTKLVLYAPTFRGTETSADSNWDIDITGCLKALEQRFGGSWAFLLRKHHLVKSGEMDESIDVSGYPDMQELLQAVDVLITDYSSSIWDYSFTGKPGFLFMPDLNTYERERSFYTDSATWPYPLAETNEEFAEIIAKFNPVENKKKIERHWKLLGNCESGKASEAIVNIIRGISID